MRRATVSALIIAATVGFAGAAFARAELKVEYLKEEPPPGAVPYRKIVYVDDGTCPKWQIKEITGGSQAKAIPRQVRCVKRPSEEAASPSAR